MDLGSMKIDEWNCIFVGFFLVTVLAGGIVIIASVYSGGRVETVEDCRKESAKERIVITNM